MAEWRAIEEPAIEKLEYYLKSYDRGLMNFKTKRPRATEIEYINFVVLPEINAALPQAKHAKHSQALNSYIQWLNERKQEVTCRVTAAGFENMFIQTTDIEKVNGAMRELMLFESGKFKRGKLDNLATVYKYLTDNNYLKAEVNQHHFSNTIIAHYNRIFLVSQIAKGKYRPEVAEAFEKLLQQ